MADNDQMFDLLTKMYSEVQGIKSDVGYMKSDIGNMKSDISNMKSEINERFDNLENVVRKTDMTIENEIKPKIDALFDGYKQNTELIFGLTTKVDNLQTDVNNLTIRTIKNENSIIQLSKHKTITGMS
ncbi:hypothetical protein [Clostridium sp. YIM B02555]|uniref:hypothetical protein n=1 Tax=Clostridium sp. YIM B02555 TaxID=2911968 RepID=UPI001EEF544E